MGVPGGCDNPTVPVDHPSPSIRQARTDEYPGLRALELESDRLFESVGIGPFADVEEENHLDGAALVLVTGEPPVGFACVDMVDGIPHLWQLSVHPEHARRGLGRALVEAVCDWARADGHDAVTLTTFRDVPWNGPFYASLGFVVIEHLPPGLLAIREHERAIGDDGFGPRVAMRRAL